MVNRIRLFLCAAAACCLAPALGFAQVTLAVDNPFPLPGGAVQLNVQGPAGSTFTVLTSQQPAGRVIGPLGTLYLAPGSFSPAGGGALDGSGQGSRMLSIADDLAPGTVLYAQVFVPGASPALSNSVVFRVSEQAPQGRRVTQAVAVTPDGSKAYVAHQVDGSVSVIDAQNDVALAELPISVPAIDIPMRALDLAVDPDGRHAFLVNAAASAISVIEAASDSVVAQIPVPRGSRRIAFDFRPGVQRIYVTNEVSNALLVFDEGPNSTFARGPNIPLQGQMPGPLAVISEQLLVVGHRASQELEFVDPTATAGSTTVNRLRLLGLPADVVLASDGSLRVPTFERSQGVPGLEGFNRVLRVDPQSATLLGTEHEDTATDYIDMAVADNLNAVVAASTGSVLFSDNAGTLLANVDLAPFQFSATPQDAAFVPGISGPDKLYVANYFRESIVSIDLSGGSFTRASEIALAWSGSPRVPLSGALSPEEDGDWFFRSVNLFNGNVATPNRVTCYTCHVDIGGDNLDRPRQVPVMWGLADTAPYGSTGNSQLLSGIVGGAVNNHNSTGLGTFPGAQDLIEVFLASRQPPQSIYLNQDGSLAPIAQAGKALFEGAAGCTTCHAAPAFIPDDPQLLTIEEGIGTGLAPANVPSLRAVWATAPYLHNGSAQTLMDVLSINPNDTHGQLAAVLNQQQRERLVAYLKTL